MVFKIQVMVYAVLVLPRHSHQLPIFKFKPIFLLFGRKTNYIFYPGKYFYNSNFQFRINLNSRGCKLVFRRIFLSHFEIFWRGFRNAGFYSIN